MMYYLSQAKLPSRRAHAIQQVRTCEGFSQTGADTTLLHPLHLTDQQPVSWDTIAEYYGVTDEFDIVSMPTLLQESGRVPKVGGASMVSSLVLFLCSRYLRGDLEETDIVFSRNRVACHIFARVLDWFGVDDGPTICHEVHSGPEQFASGFFHVVDGLVCVTEVLKDDIVDAYGLSPDRCLVAPDGVRLDSYDQLDRESIRASLDLPDGPVVMYTGHVYPDQSGVGTLVEAAADIDAPVYVVGGYESDIERVKSEHDVPKNVMFTGFVKPSEIRRYQVSADVLVAPYPAASRDYMSPLKLFEYMAAGVPVIASNKPVLKEILTDEENCLLFDTDDSKDLARKVSRLLNDRNLGDRLVARASEDVEEYDWQVRAERIRSFCNQL